MGNNPFGGIPCGNGPSVDWRKVILPGPGGVSLPECVSPAFRALVEAIPSSTARGALLRQVESSDDESVILSSESPDPRGEGRWCVSPRLVHQYANRVTLLATGRCLGHCRFCFRRNYIALGEGYIDGEELAAACRYLAVNVSVQEILVSGGDPLSGTTAELLGVLDAIRASRPDILIQLCTRAPVFAPELCTESLVSELKKRRPLWLVSHINHPDELGDDQVRALSRCIDSGIPVLSETVLLSGVNDDPKILSRLFHRLSCIGVKTGSLLQCDLAPGTSGFRVPLSRGIAIWRTLGTMLSGVSLPVYAVDLPGGGGTVPLSSVAFGDTASLDPSGDTLTASGNDGKVYTYHS